MYIRGKKKVLRDNGAFTLVELIIVIAIMAILAGAIAPAMIRYIRKARASKATEEARVIMQSVQHSIASARGEDLDIVVDKQFIDQAGNSHACSVITNYDISRAQNNVAVAEGDPGYSDYVLSQDILEELHSSSGSEYKFYRFNGSQSNPLGANCEQFYAQYGCPGIIVAYDDSGYVFFLEYYNFGCLIRYEDGEYTYCEKEEKFSGSDKIQY